MRFLLHVTVEDFRQLEDDCPNVAAQIAHSLPNKISTEIRQIEHQRQMLIQRERELSDWHQLAAYVRAAHG